MHRLTLWGALACATVLMSSCSDAEGPQVVVLEDAPGPVQGLTFCDYTCDPVGADNKGPLGAGRCFSIILSPGADNSDTIVRYKFRRQTWFVNIHDAVDGATYRLWPAHSSETDARVDPATVTHVSCSSS